MTTENEKIALKLVEGCTHVYPKSTGSCRFCTSEALDAKDLTISQLKADVERLKENQSALQSGGILHNERMRIRKLESEKEALEKREHIAGCYFVYGDCTCEDLHKKIKSELEQEIKCHLKYLSDANIALRIAKEKIASLEEKVKRMEGVVEATRDSISWLQIVEDSGIRYVCLGARGQKIVFENALRLLDEPTGEDERRKGGEA